MWGYKNYNNATSRLMGFLLSYIEWIIGWETCDSAPKDCYWQKQASLPRIKAFNRQKNWFSCVPNMHSCLFLILQHSHSPREDPNHWDCKGCPSRIRPVVNLLLSSVSECSTHRWERETAQVWEQVCVTGLFMSQVGGCFGLCRILESGAADTPPFSFT